MASKARTSRNRDIWGGMGFLLVFFPDFEEPISNNPSSKLLSSSLSSPASLHSFLRRVSSTNLLNRAQSTISICALLVLFSVLLFTLSTVDPLSTKQWKQNPNPPLMDKPSSTHHAFQRMGKLYRRGTRAMNDLVIGHISESITSQDLRLFLRVLHRSGLTSRADIVFIFPCSVSSLEDVIMEENDSFEKLLTRSNSNVSVGFDLTQFVKSVRNENKWKESIWGRRNRGNNNNGEGENGSTRLSYGSVVSFLASELDPENSLAGFVDHVHMNLRRWAAYPMLLGRLRRNFKHIALIDVSQILIIGDPLTRVRTQSPESVEFFTDSETTGRKTPAIVPGLVIGGTRGVRRFSATLLTEIVRVSGGGVGNSHKKKNVVVSEAGILDRIVRNEYLMKSANVVAEVESIGGESSDSSSLDSNVNSNGVILRRGNRNGRFWYHLL
ncbi:uncharacterized protein LOC124934542 [Impatiens glandulifera]|uniref:uncharacterized protein LOC124934542 n=1 Tax=Impatiens glandulifera TaxID=253017 RepID=UPI001FB13AFA|nr:uncharacterized protein LOC124934542 [Impatiens glandulifera]